MFLYTYLFLFRDPTLTLVEAPLLQPAEMNMDNDHIQQMNHELEQAAQMELPEGEDEAF